MAHIQPRKEIEKVQAYFLGESIEELQTRYSIDRFCRMSDNENVYGSSHLIQKHLVNFSETIHYYPDGNTTKLVEKLSGLHKLPMDSFVIGNGSDEVIRLLTRAYLNQGDEAVMADGTFPRYETNVRIDGGIPVKVPLINGIHDLNEMLNAINTKTKMIFICNPNNPTGTIVSKEQLEAFIQSVPKHILIVVDEAYAEYATSELYGEMLPLISQCPNLIVLKTFSKIYGIASLRVGFGAMNPELAANLKKAKDVFNVNQMAQIAASAAIDDQEFVVVSAKKNAAERDRTAKELRKYGYKPLPSETNFLFIPINEGIADLQESLLKKGLLVKRLGVPEFPNALRMTLGTEMDNNLFLQVMEAFAKESVV